MEETRIPLDHIEIGDIVTFYNNGNKSIGMVKSFEYGEGNIPKQAPRFVWAKCDIDGVWYSDWSIDNMDFYKANKEEEQEFYNSIPGYMKGSITRVVEKKENESKKN